MCTLSHAVLAAALAASLACGNAQAATAPKSRFTADPYPSTQIRNARG